MNWRAQHRTSDNIRIMSDDFVNNAVGFLKSERRKRDSDTSRMELEQHATDAKCPAFWSDVRTKVKRICDQIETDMGEQLFSWPDRIGTHELRVSGSISSGVRTLSAGHDESTHRITYSVQAGSMQAGYGGGSFTPYLAGTDVVYSDGSEPVSAEQAAQRMVSALIGRRS